MQVRQCLVVFDAGSQGLRALNTDDVAIKEQLRQELLVGETF